MTIPTEVPYVKIQIKLILPDNKTSSKGSRKIRRIHHFINNHQEFKSAYLKVSYSPTDKWLVNQYDCETVDELRAALLACTEPELIEYLTQGKWSKISVGERV